MNKTLQVFFALAFAWITEKHRLCSNGQGFGSVSRIKDCGESALTNQLKLKALALNRS